MDDLELTRRLLGGDATPETLERIRSRVREGIDREGRPRGPRWGAILAAAAVLALVGLVISLVVPTPHEAAAAELRRLGTIAAGKEPIRQGPAEFVLISWEELRREMFEDITLQSSFDYLSRLRVSTWVAADGSAVRHEEVLATDFASEADRLAWIEAGQPNLFTPRIHEYPSGEGIHEVEGLPDRPDALRAALRSGTVAVRPPGDDQVFVLIGELLAQGNAPPDVQAALFEVAAGLAGVELVGSVEDPLDRMGTAVEIATSNSRTRLVFDPDTARLLAIEVYTILEEGEELSSWSAFEPTIVVDEGPPLER